MSQLQLAPKVVALIDTVEIADGALKAEHAGEVFEAETPAGMARQLGNAFYETMHSGRDKLPDLKQRSLRERAFDALLHDATGGRTTVVEVQVLEAADTDETIVAVDGLRLRVPNEFLEAGTGTAARMTLPCARPGLSPGFFLATSGNVPFRHTGALLRMYGRLEDPDAAPEVWRALVAFLEDARIPWQAKISSNRSIYPRNDAVVVYLPRPGWRAARACAQALQGTELLAAGTSPFTRALTASVSCAFEPTDTRGSRRGVSFGQHRAQVFAEALVRHAAMPATDREPVTDTLYAAFVDADIDPAEPARNLSSPVVDVLSPF